MKHYRKMLSRANRRLNTVEVHMCHDGADPACPKEGDWDIDFTKAPGRCQHVHKAAFEKHRPDRWAAYLESLNAPDSKGAKGTSVFITDLCGRLSPCDDKLAEAQWKDQVKNLREAAAANGHDLGEFLSNFVCLLDFSGSMMGEPIKLAMAMGAFITPLQKGAFRNKCISFETRPHWIDITGTRSVHEAIRVYQRSPWGGSTNFISAHSMILQVLRNEKRRGTSNEGIKSLLPKFFLVVSDMQFDSAHQIAGGWQTMHTTLQTLYRDTGMELIGEPLVLPPMVYWNARGDTGGMPVCRSSEKALFVTGVSTAVVKTFLTSGIEDLASMTPWRYLHKTLTSDWYQRILATPAAAPAAGAGAAPATTRAAPAAAAGAGAAGAGAAPTAGARAVPTAKAAPAAGAVEGAGVAAGGGRFSTPPRQVRDDPFAPPPVGLIRSVGMSKFAQGLEVLDWVRTLGDETVAGRPARDITIFPVSVYYANRFPCDEDTPQSVHWIGLGEEPSDGHNERFDARNPTHQFAVRLFDWWDCDGRYRYFSGTVRELFLAPSSQTMARQTGRG